MFRLTAALALAALLVACSRPAPADSEPPEALAAACAPTVADAEPQAFSGLENVVAYAPRVYSGSVPHGVKRAPRPSERFAAAIRPPWPRTMPAAVNSPRPTPRTSAFVVKKGSKT